jgi:hypothetical protein
MDNKNLNLRIDLLTKIYDLERKGIKPRKIITIEEPIESLIYEYALLQKKEKKIYKDQMLDMLLYLVWHSK